MYAVLNEPSVALRNIPVALPLCATLLTRTYPLPPIGTSGSAFWSTST